MFKRAKFESPRANKREKTPFWKRWRSAWTAGLCVLGVMTSKPTMAQDQQPVVEELVNKSRAAREQVELLPQDKLEFLKRAPSIEEQTKVEQLRARLNNIANKTILSTPEKTSNLQQSPENINGNIYSGVQTIDTKTRAYFLEKPENPYTDIVTENTTTEIGIGTQRSTTRITNSVPVSEGVLTSESFAFVENEAGEYESKLPQRRGYINADGTLNPTVAQSAGGVNLKENSGYERGAIIDSAVIEQIKTPGEVSRDFTNEHGYVVQGRAFQNYGTLQTEVEKETEASYRATVSQTTKHTHSNEEKTVIRESERTYGYESNTAPAANILLNVAAGATPSSLKKPLAKAKTQAEVREVVGQAPTKRATIHSPEILEKLGSTKARLDADLQPRVRESRLQALKDQSKGSFVGVDVGTQTVVRQETEAKLKQTTPSDYRTQLRRGIETDAGSDATVLLNGATPTRDAVTGIYMGLDTRGYEIQNIQESTTHRRAEVTAGVSAGLVRGQGVAGVRAGINYDEINDQVYPTLKAQTQYGNTTNIQAQAHYSPNPSISHPNEAQVTMSTQFDLSSKSTAKLTASQTINLGDNRTGYKTRASVGGAAQLGRRIKISGEVMLGNGENSDKGYLLGAVVKQNWGAVYANYKRLNDTRTVGGGVSVRAGQRTTVSGEYQQTKNDTSDLFDSHTVKVKLRREF